MQRLLATLFVTTICAVCAVGQSCMDWAYASDPWHNVNCPAISSGVSHSLVYFDGYSYLMTGYASGICGSSLQCDGSEYEIWSRPEFGQGQNLEEPWGGAIRSYYYFDSWDGEIWSRWFECPPDSAITYGREAGTQLSTHPYEHSYTHYC